MEDYRRGLIAVVDGQIVRVLLGLCPVVMMSSGGDCSGSSSPRLRWGWMSGQSECVSDALSVGVPCLCVGCLDGLLSHFLSCGLVEEFFDGLTDGFGLLGGYDEA